MLFITPHLLLHAKHTQNTNISGSSVSVIDRVEKGGGIFTQRPRVIVNMTCQSQRKGTVRGCVTNNRAAQHDFGVLSCADILLITWLTANESHWKLNQTAVAAATRLFSDFPAPMYYSVVFPSWELPQLLSLVRDLLVNAKKLITAMIHRLFHSSSL